MDVSDKEGTRMQKRIAMGETSPLGGENFGVQQFADMQGGTNPDQRGGVTKRNMRDGTRNAPLDSGDGMRSQSNPDHGKY